MYQDITERKQAEEALRYERDLLQIFMDNIPDTVYFKDSGSPIRAKALVSKVRQYHLSTLNDSRKIIDQYGSSRKIDNHDNNVSHWAVGKNYAVLIWLKDVKEIDPFNIDKRGFGCGAAWITVDNIDKIRLPIRR